MFSLVHDFVHQHVVHIKTRFFQLDVIIWNILMKCCVSETDMKDWCNLEVGIMIDECFLHVEQLYTMTLAGKPWTAEMSRLGIHDYYWNAEVFVCPNFVTRPFVDTTQEVLEQKWTRQGFSNPQGIKLRTSQLVWITPPVTTLPMLLDSPTLTRNMMFEQKHTKTVDYTYLQAPLSQWCCFA